ncbi:MAG TPA: hypothetical protein VFF29_04030 [Bacteroidota bacterium]|nr:hypothetical protein [Bacteroidota bacterium]
MKKPVIIISIIISFGLPILMLVSSKQQVDEAQKLEREEHRGAWGMFEAWYN